MTDKIHILVTNDTPFLDHTDVKVLCGEVVKDAMKGFVWNISAIEDGEWVHDGDNSPECFMPPYTQKAVPKIRERIVEASNQVS